MKFRKLEREEHWKARALWEQIFKEDTGAFLDYYYSVKTNENEIFVAEEDENIVAMLHLNPYTMRINDQIHSTNYIVAVATDERYRKRGFMSALLKRAMQVMYERKEPFTFLMPAAEAIYYPFDFRFVYKQGQSLIRGKNRKDDLLEIVTAKKNDCAEIAEFANHYLKECQVVAKRDEAYYQTLIEEHQSEDGEVVFARRAGCMAGVLCYAKGERIIIREPLFGSRGDLEAVVYSLTGNISTQVKCIGYGEEECVPMIMARILHLETFMKTLKLKDDVEIVMKIRDEILPGNSGVFRIAGNREHGIETVERLSELEQIQGEISIGTLTSILFGYCTAEEGERREPISQDLKKVFQNIVKLEKVFLNEVV